jgi:hypothetical protein
MIKGELVGIDGKRKKNADIVGIYIIIINYTYIIAICGIIVGIVPTKLVLDL